MLDEKLIKSYLSKELVLIVGAGLSWGAYDSWPNLIRRLAKAANTETKIKDDSCVQELIDETCRIKKISSVTYYHTLLSHFKEHDPLHVKPYSIIGQMKALRCILTTNFDRLLHEAYCKSYTVNNRPIYTLSNYFTALTVFDAPAVSMGNITRIPPLVYMHGHVDEWKAQPFDVVLSEDEFELYYKRQLNAFLSEIFLNKPVLAIGFRPRDPYFISVIDRLMIQMNQMGLHKFKGIFVAVEENEMRDPIKVSKAMEIDPREGGKIIGWGDFLREKGMTPVTYKKIDDKYSGMQDFLTNIAYFEPTRMSSVDAFSDLKIPTAPGGFQ